MRAWIRGFVVVSGLVLLVGCREIRVENGEVPDKYLPLAQKYMGSYHGKMGKTPGTLTLSLQGNKVVADYRNQYGTDLLDPRCDSRIGDVVVVKVDDDGQGSYKLEKAKFAFNPNGCWTSVQGRELILEFKEKDAKISVSASILVETEWEETCRINPGNPAAGIPPRQECAPHQVARYHSGRFAR